MEKEFSRYKNLLERIGDKVSKRKGHSQIIDEFYDDNIIQIENCQNPITGKAVLKKLENKNLDGVNSVSTVIKDVILDKENETAWGQMIIRFDSIKNGQQRLEEAFFQRWSNGKIIYQRFFYSELINEDKESLNKTT